VTYIVEQLQTQQEVKMADVSMQVFDNGPLVVTGVFQLQDGSGNEVSKDEGRPIAFCRCGASENKPYCDGSHKNCGFSSSIGG
jgi:CDGSH-type Zn-finger protein